MDPGRPVTTKTLDEALKVQSKNEARVQAGLRKSR